MDEIKVRSHEMGFEKSHMILYLYLCVSVGPVQNGERCTVVIRMLAISEPRVLFKFFISGLQNVRKKISGYPKNISKRG